MRSRGKQMQAVIAYNHEAYLNFLREEAEKSGKDFKELQKEFFYAFRPEAIYGKEITNIITHGHWYRREDGHKLYQLCKTRLKRQA